VRFGKIQNQTDNEIAGKELIKEAKKCSSIFEKPWFVRGLLFLTTKKMEMRK
jgi:hypothetical protein